MRKKRKKRKREKEKKVKKEKEEGKVSSQLMLLSPDLGGVESRNI